MPVPAFRNSRSRVRRRRSHHALKPVQGTVCANCSATILPHRACQHCGFFKGRVLSGFATEQDLTKTIKKAKKAADDHAGHDHDHDDHTGHNHA